MAPTIRRFPNAIRSLGEALDPNAFRSAQRGSASANSTSRHDREALRLDVRVVPHCPPRGAPEVPASWMSGSSSIARSRISVYESSRRGWIVRHLPVMTVLHHVDRDRADPKLAAQDAYSRIQFAEKHFSAPHRTAYRGALALGYVSLRGAPPGRARSDQRHAARAALRSPHGSRSTAVRSPPSQALWPLDTAEAK